jgi:lactoylglutathione lyase
VPEATQGFVLNHSMLRVKDPAVSLDFYTRVMGMRALRKLDFPEMKFSLYFLARIDENDEVPEEEGKRTAWTFSQRGILELTHNWGTETDPEFKYHDGNQQPQGFGHICFSVPDLAAAVRWFDENQVPYVKRPEQGKMKDVAFIKDPDGYWIEIVQPSLLHKLGT